MRKLGSEGSARDWALNMLSARALSKAELEQKLAKKGVEETELASVIDWLEELGLLNDEEYACSVVRHYATRGYGIYKMKQELCRRGVAKELWDKALAECSDPADTIDAFLSRRLDSEAGPAQIKKCYDSLLRRGFTHSEIGAALRRRNISTEDD